MSLVAGPARAKDSPTPGTTSRYLLSVWAGLEQMRAEETRVINAYLERLGRFAAASATSGPASAQSGEPWPVVGNLGSRFRRLGRALAGLAKALVLVPSLLAQARRMHGIRKARDRAAMVVGIASNRLPLNSSLSTRAELARLARVLGNARDADIATRMTSREYILLFDALPVSRFWKHRRKCWRDDVLVVDGAFLAALFVLALCARPREAWRTYRWYASDGSAYLGSENGRRASARRARLCALVATAYGEALRGLAIPEAVFFTSNSRLTELLRAYLIHLKECERIYDVMHGVGSVQAERFVTGMLSEGAEFRADERYVFVPQVPNLPLHGAFQRHAIDGGVAINAYLNNYFIGREGEPTLTLPAFVESEYRAICPGPRRVRDPLIVTLFGTYDDGRPFFESAAFVAECLLLALIGQCRSRARADAITLYVPHPKHGAATLSHPIFAATGATVYRHSVFCWLVSDLCVSLLSSAMFEAVYFGARGFTPLTRGDDLYTPYLDLVRHPRSDSFDGLVTELRHVVAACSEAPRLDILERARRRRELMRYDDAFLPGGSALGDSKRP